ncbi:MAG TPA: hypothetical protein VGA08_00530, partial [Candidatus Saccharimonadales bacterium]
FLENTVDKDGCNANNAGCQWYSQSRDLAGDWQASDKIYLNRQAEACSSEFAGCSQYKKITNTVGNLTTSQVLNAVLADPARIADYSDYGQAADIYLNGNAAVCSQREVGCDIYTPINGDPVVTAVGQARDVCPVECVGYQSYKQAGTYLEEEKFPVYFIAETAVQCTAAQAGCDEFTNLDTVAAGGEGVEYYQYLRQCQKPSPVNLDCGSYFTWQGSDTTGFQLIAYNLKALNPDGGGAPFTTNGSTDCQDPNNPDCREFFDQAGNVYYRDYKATVTCSEDCHPYRKTASTETDCLNSNGSWSVVQQQCVYSAIPTQGLTCDASASGCRAYIGNAGSNVAQIMTDDFEDGNTAGWSNGTISTESIKFGGRSMKFSASNQYQLGSRLNQNSAYTLSFWFKNSVSAVTSIDVRVGQNLNNPDRSADRLIGSFTTYTAEWNIYNLGPLILDRAPTTDDRLILVVGGTNDVFIDNIILKEVRQNLYLIKNSWKTPSSCETDPPLTGGTAVSSMLGCQAYQNRQGQTNFFKSFSQLCTEDKVGCEELIETKNSESPYQQIFNPGASAITVPQDSLAYVVNNPNNYCPREEKGCRALGLPTVDIDDNVIAYSDVYYKSDPEKYNQILCQEQFLGCQEYSKEGGLVYFKDPG